MEAIGAFLVVLSCLTITHAWSCTESVKLYPAAQIDAGNGQVLATDPNDNVYFLSGESWHRLGSRKLSHVSVGPAGIWGVDSSSKVYKYVAGQFRSSNGLSMQQIDAGGDGQVVGVNSYTAYCLKSTEAWAYAGAGHLSWNSLSVVLMYVSCGPNYGCWGIDKSDGIYFTQNVSPTTCKSSGSWSRIEGHARKVEVGTDGKVFVVNRDGAVVQRTGISAVHPQGLGWKGIQTCSPIRHLSYDLGTLWVVTDTGLIMKCTI